MRKGTVCYPSIRYGDEWPLCEGLAGLPGCILWLFKVRQDQIHIIILCFLELFIKPWLSCCVKVSGQMTCTGFTLQLGETCLSLPRGISGYQKTYSGERGGMTSYGLTSQWGEVAMLLMASCFGNWKLQWVSKSVSYAGFIFQGLISAKECLKGNHVAFDKYMRYLEDNHPRERTRLSKQTWLRVTGSTDLVLRDLQRR